MQPPLRYLKTSAAEIPYYSWEVAAPNAVMVFLHGLKSHSGWFLTSGEDFARHSIKAYVFDRRGSGKSETARGDIQNYLEWLEDVHAVVSLAKQENPGIDCHLLGHCFGAKLALGYALLHPEEIRSLSLIAPPQMALKADLRTWDKLKTGLSMASGCTFQVQVPVKDEMFTNVPDKLAFIRGDPLRLQRMTTRFCIEVRKIDRWIDRNLEEIQIPISILLAREDPVIDNEKARTRLFPRLGSPVKKITEFDCRHHLLFEPLREKVIEDIVAWMKDGAIPCAPAEAVSNAAQNCMA